MDNHPKAVAARFYDIINSADVNRLDGICAPDLRGHAGAGATLDELKASVTGFMAAFPDLRADVRHLIAEGDTVSAWLTYDATHQGEFAGVPGTGRTVKFAAWDLLRVADGRVVELTQYCDLFTILNQIGALPTAAPA
jgi:steroid delta-isomerase-like uncharacterized protein